MRRSSALLVAMVVALCLDACGDSGSSGSKTSGTQTTQAPTGGISVADRVVIDRIGVPRDQAAKALADEAQAEKAGDVVGMRRSVDAFAQATRGIGSLAARLGGDRLRTGYGYLVRAFTGIATALDHYVAYVEHPSGGSAGLAKVRQGLKDANEVAVQATARMNAIFASLGSPRPAR